MQRDARSAFESALVNAGGSRQTEVAERLHLSKRALQTYLYGDGYPPCDVIAKAVEEYGIHDFALEHLSTNCPIAKLYLGELKSMSLAGAVLAMQKEMEDVDNLRTDLIRMACNDRVAATERHLWDKKVVVEIRGAISSLVSVVAAGMRG